MAVGAPHDTVGKLIRAAAKAGVSYVLPNWFGHDHANRVLLDDSMIGQVRDSVHAAFDQFRDTSYLLLVCGFWYEFSLGGGPDHYGFDFEKRSFVRFDNGDVPINTSTWPQCGRAVASLLGLKELPEDEEDQSTTLSQFLNGPVYVSSFRLSQRDMFESVKHVTGTTDTGWTITHESSEQRWRDGRAQVLQGNFEHFPKQLYSRMFFSSRDGDFESRHGLHNELLGLPVEDLDEATARAIHLGESGEMATTH